MLVLLGALAGGLPACATHGHVVAAPEECERAGGVWRSTLTCEYVAGGASM
jgi:hypothetical protein